MSMVGGGVTLTATFDFIRLVLVSNSIILLKGLKNICEQRQQFIVINSCYSLADVRDCLDKKPADIILIDFCIAEEDSQASLINIQKQFPDIRIVLIIHDTLNIQKKINTQLNINGLLSKSVSEEDLFTALMIAYRNGYMLCSELKKTIEIISPKENEIVFSSSELLITRLICQDFCSKEIAYKTGIKVRTVESIKSRLFKKVGVKSIAGFAIYAIQNNLL